MRKHDGCIVLRRRRDVQIFQLVKYDGDKGVEQVCALEVH